MCLAVPGEILSIDYAELVNEPHDQCVNPLNRTGRVRFGALIKAINLALVPEAGPGDFVLVHAGIAITQIDTTQAIETQKLLDCIK